MALKLAYRNLIGAGLRTWLNVFVLSFSFVVIIWMNGLMAGWDYQAKTDMTNWQIGGGQYWHEQYDPYDPFTLTESHAPVPAEFRDELTWNNGAHAGGAGYNLSGRPDATCFHYRDQTRAGNPDDSNPQTGYCSYRCCAGCNWSRIIAKHADNGG
jgi:hypothetical protein